MVQVSHQCEHRSFVCLKRCNSDLFIIAPLPAAFNAECFLLLQNLLLLLMSRGEKQEYLEKFLLLCGVALVFHLFPHGMALPLGKTDILLFSAYTAQNEDIYT